MKSFTDIEQSKKLAEILPIESADMWFYNGIVVARDSTNEPDDIKSVLPCWSLASLLGVINKDYYTALYHDGVAWNFDVTHHNNETDKHNTFADTPVDACVEMINKLHKLNSL